MATWDDVRRLALALPEATERPSYDLAPAWRVRDKLFAWDRPLRGADLAALGDAAPDGPVLAVRVPDVGAKEALVAGSAYAFDIPHLDGYPAVLLRLDDVPVDELEELLTEAWLARAPKRLAQAYLERPGG